MPSNTDLAAILGMNSKSSLSNILAGTNNIQPEAWELFKARYGARDGDSSNLSEHPAPKPPSAMVILDRLSQAFLEQAEGFKAQAEALRTQGEMMAIIRKEMAREDTQAKIDDKIKKVGDHTKELAVNLNYILAVVEKISIRQDAGIIEIQDKISESQSGKTGISKDERNKLGQIDEDAKKQDKHP